MDKARPVIPYYGGKSRLAPLIADLLPRHDTYVEPFCGSAAVLFAKAPSRHEIINDVWGDLVCFLRVLRDEPAELVRVCSLTPYAREEFEACVERPDDLTDLERARRTWVRIVQAYAAATGDWHKLSWSLSVRNNTADPRYAQSLVSRMQAASRRLVRVAIDNRPALEVLSRYDDPGVVIYCDPPYLATSRRSKGAISRSSLSDYTHDMSSESEHRELASVLLQTKSAVLLSAYPSALYEELYAGWHKLELKVTKHASNRRGVEHEKATEVIWSNRPLRNAQRLFEVSA